MFKAPAIYFPSTVVFFDDDPLYAKLLIERLQIDGLKHFESPDFLLKQKGDDFLFIDSDIFRKAKTGDFEYVKAHLQALKKSKTLISVVISDLHMDTYSGTEIFSQLNSPYIGRILVSNFIDYQKNSEVAELRNDGLVDIVLDKTKNFVEELPKAIKAAKNKFFTLLSNTLYSDVCDGHALFDTEFAKFFIAKIDEIKPYEIRANSTFNKFTFTFKEKHPNLILHITDKQEIQSYLESSAAESAPSELLAHLFSGEYMLCYEDDVLPDGKLWPLLIRPAKQFDGKNTRFFYSISEAQQ
jgi:CheY-like chemotaxis protein